MAVNFFLASRQPNDDDDPMNRSWFGWDPYATDDELWEINRGVWRMRNGASNERFATLSHDGVIQVAAEITDRERYAVGDGFKWALVGNVLRPGDPVRDALVGSPAPTQRNPVAYFDTSNLEALGAAERARFQARDRVTLLATWNPAKWTWNDVDEEVAATQSGGIVRGNWATGGRRSGVEPGDRIFLLKQGQEPRGIIGSGTCTSRIFQGQHWDASRDDAANYVLAEWDTLVPPDDPLRHADLVARIPAGGNWSPQSGGTILDSGIADALEALWAEHLGQPAPVPPRTSKRQGWQLDAQRRKKIEDAAQARLEAHFRREGWDVRDVRHGNSYDAIATRRGQRTLYLEAKGTATAGDSVIVTRGEVKWARQHPGQCMLGILSDVRLLANGEIDADGGTFRICKWDPDNGELVPRDFDFTPASANPPRGSR